MTREEEIIQASKEFSRDTFSVRPGLVEDSFIEGAKWADKHSNWHFVADGDLPPIIKGSKSNSAINGEDIVEGYYHYACKYCFCSHIIHNVPYWMEL